jgi:hypothetical protein
VLTEVLESKKSFLNKFILAKDEFVSMKLHFRYHTYLYTKKGGTIHDGCKYCQDGLVNSNAEAANENKGERGEKGGRSGELFNIDKK